MARVLIYCTASCPYCQAADRLLARKGVSEIERVRVDLHPEPVRELRRFADRYFPLIPYYSLRPFDPDLPRADDWLRDHRG